MEGVDLYWGVGGRSVIVFLLFLCFSASVFCIAMTPVPLSRRTTA